MKILAVDTTTDQGSVALGERGNVTLSQSYLNETRSGRRHSEKLIPLIEELLSQAGWDFGELEAYLVCVGPGAFTGLRVGISAVKGMGAVYDLPTFSITSSETLSHAIFQTHPEIQWASAVIDAKRSEIYASLWERGKALPVVETHLVQPAAWAEYLQREIPDVKNIMLAGNGLFSYRDLFEETFSQLRGTDLLYYPSAGSALEVFYVRKGRIASPISAANLSPVYLRKSDFQASRHS